MNKKFGLLVNAGVCLAVITVMFGSGFILLSTENEVVTTGSKVEAALYDPTVEYEPILAELDIEYVKPNNAAVDDGEKAINVKTSETVIPQEKVEQLPKDEPDEQPSLKTAAKAPVEYRAGDDTSEKKTHTLPPIEAQNEDPSVSPVNNQTSVPETEIMGLSDESELVTYTWGAMNSYTFRIEVKLTNNGSDTASNIVVEVPLLENDSPYQTTTLKSVNYDIESSTGRISSFNIGELAPGETRTVVADFTVNVRAVSINSTNDTVEKARIAYDQYAGSGNCRTLALGFIDKSRELGITAREVIGFARPEKGPMISGSLKDYRHSWAEFYVNGLGWVPVDLTFQYFGAFPTTSHIVESYSDQSIKVNYTGGSLSASWNNIIL